MPCVHASEIVIYEVELSSVKKTAIPKPMGCEMVFNHLSQTKNQLRPYSLLPSV
jgi:hypothetical protein